MFKNRSPLRFIPVTARIIAQQNKETFKKQQIKYKKTNQLTQTRRFFANIPPLFENIPPPDPNKLTLIGLIIGIYYTIFKS